MHPQDPANWHYLVNRYFNNTISREELDELLSMAESGQYDDALSTALLQQWEATRNAQPSAPIDWDNKLEAMLQQHRTDAAVIPVTRRRKWWLPAAAAAVLLLTTGAGIYYSTLPAENAMAGNTIMVMEADTIILKPGTHGALLTLADGRTIELDSAGNGLLATQGNTQVTSQNGAIRYNNGNNKTSDIIFNTLSTPRGKQFKLQLSDGTTVWLNAASSIRFPAVFVGDKRIVQVTGEAYFEVAHIDQPQQGGNGAALPFVVQFTHPNGSQGQVEVLGTHFNINAYADEAAVRTTLLEGKVKVTMKDQSTLLAPGQQACLNKQGHLQKNDHIDIDAVMAWKNGYFSFNETDMATLMRQIARWYDVDIEYAGAVPNRKFGGEISRNSNANDILKIMEASAVKFTVTGRKIIVAP